MNPWHIVDGECIKRKFGTEFSALRFVKEAGLKGHVSAYLCAACNSWHLSTNVRQHDNLSQPKFDLQPVEPVYEDAPFWEHRIYIRSRYGKRKVPKRRPSK